VSAVANVFGLDLVAKVILGVTGIVLIRLMPSDEYARYTFAIAIIAMVTEALIGSWRSVYVAGMRRFGARDSAGTFLGAQILIVVVAVLATVPFREAASGLYFVIVVAIAGKALVEVARGSLQRALRFSSYAGVELARAVLLCASVWVVAAAVGQEMRAWQPLSLEAAGLVGLGLYLLISQRGLPGILRIREAARLIRTVLASDYRYFGAYMIVLALFGQQDIFLLRVLGGELPLATYGSTLRYYALLSMALAAVHAVFLPLAQRVETAEDMNRLLASHRKLVVAFAPVAIVGIVVAGWAIPWIDQGRYPGAVLAFRILAISSVVSFTFSPYVNLLIRFEDFRFMLVILMIGLFLDAGLNLALIPTAGAAGAAVASSLSSGLITTSIFVRTRKFRRTLVISRPQPSTSP
jgi:O-antigen/teichoic acid export membrane protein